MKDNCSESSAIILLYHRVVELDSDPQLLCVRPRHFAEHLEILRRHMHVMSLAELVQTLRDGAVPRSAAAITFDDGYADNLLTAKPILQRHNCPATVFPVSGQIGSEREFWWDELERLLLRSGDQFPQWNVLQATDPTPRHALYRTLCDLYHPLAAQQQDRLLRQLRIWAAAGTVGRRSHRSMTSSELRGLTADGLIDIGAHTVTHPLLAAQPISQQRKEIRQSKAALEEILGRPLISFSYPYGYPASYTADTVAEVRAAGLTCACSNFPALLQRDSDPFQLPRFLVRDWDGEEFSRRLHQFIAARHGRRDNSLAA